MSAIRSPLAFENFHIFIQGQKRKHFQYVISWYIIPTNATKVEFFFHLNNTL